MTKRRAAVRTTPLADTLPERAEVERAIEAVLDRLRPKDSPRAKDPLGAKQPLGSKDPWRDEDQPRPKPAGAAPARKSGPRRTGA